MSLYLTKGHLTNKTNPLQELIAPKRQAQVTYEVTSQARLYFTKQRKIIRLYVPNKPIQKIDNRYTSSYDNSALIRTLRGQSVNQKENIERSTRRSKSAIIGYALNNDFSHFVTFTFRDERHNDDQVLKRLMAYLTQMRRNYPGFQYLIVPERHKSGALHFHGLINGIPDPEFIPAINNDPTSKYYQQPLRRTRRGTADTYPVFNLLSFNRYGFSDAERIESPEKIANYISKYITKELVTSFNKKRYWASRNLRAPVNLDNFDPTTIEGIKLRSMGNNEYGNFYTYEVPENLTLPLQGMGGFAPRAAANSSPPTPRNH